MKTLVIVTTFVTTFIASTAAFAFDLKSPQIKQGSKISEEHVFNGFGCTGKNVSPELVWKKAPKNTKYYAVTMYDPDAPTGSGWWHWVVYNIPASVTSLPAGAGGEGGKLPEGAKQGRTDYGTAAYGGPCPPPGKPHRYVFTVIALKDRIEVPENATAAYIGFNLNAQKLGVAKFSASYRRAKN